MEAWKKAWLWLGKGRLRIRKGSEVCRESTPERSDRMQLERMVYMASLSTVSEIPCTMQEDLQLWNISSTEKRKESRKKAKRVSSNLSRYRKIKLGGDRWKDRNVRLRKPEYV